MFPARSISCFVTATLLSCGSATDVYAQDPAKGAALLAEARAAVGGDARLRAIKALDVRGDFKRAAGQMTLEGELQIRIELPDKLRRDEDVILPGGGPAIVRTEVLNGGTVWDENSGRAGLFVERFGRGTAGRGGGPNGRGRAPLDPAEVEQAQRRARQTDLARFLLAWLLATDGPVVWIGTAEAPDGKADVLEITPPAGPATRLFLDVASHMPLMMTWQGTAPLLLARGRGTDSAPPQRPQGPQQGTLQMTLGAYKSVNGIMLPHLVTRGINGMTIEEWTIDTYRINPTFRSNVFSK